jgi:hypothetical protein
MDEEEQYNNAIGNTADEDELLEAINEHERNFSI